jgi:enoyl-CoA hydratase/carnithine racemase
MSTVEAHSWGLCTETTAAGDHLTTALTIAAELAGQPPMAVAVAKQVITAATDAPRETALLLEQLAYATLNRIG